MATSLPLPQPGTLEFATRKAASDALATYLPIMRSSGYIGNVGVANNWLAMPNGNVVAPATNLSSYARFFIDPALHAIKDKATKLRLIAKGHHNNGAPGAGATLGMRLEPVSANTATGNLCVTPSGTAVPGSSCAAVALATSTDPYSWDSGDFDIPAAGGYALTLQLAVAALSAASYVPFSWTVYMRRI